MKELGYVYTISFYAVLCVISFIATDQAITDNTLFEFATAYNCTFPLVILYYMLYLWTPSIIKFKMISFLVLHYVLYLIVCILTIVYYDSLDVDMLHLFIFVLVCDLACVFLHVTQIYAFVKKQYEPIL